MKRSVKIIAAALAGLLSAGSIPAAAESTDKDTAFFDAAVIAPEGVTVSKETVLDYVHGSIFMNYRFENTTDSEASCFAGVPVTSTLDSVHQNQYRIELADADGSALDGTLLSYFTPLFSSAGISEEKITAKQLYELRAAAVALPGEPGVWYTFSFDQVPEEPTPVLSVSALEQEGCRIYPINCSYSASEGSYEISAAAGKDTCYAFIVGKEGQSFSADPPKDSAARLSSKTASLNDFIDFSCEYFLEETPLNDPVDKEELLKHLTTYIGGITSNVSLDLIPSIQWLVQQHLFEVYACEFSLAPGEAAVVSIARTCALPVSGVSLNPVLTNSGSPLASNQLLIVAPEEYTRASLRKAKGSFDSKTSVLTVKEADNGIYQVILSKTPIWVKAYRYIIPMSVIMVLFLAVCVIVYLAEKKRNPQKAADDTGKSKTSIK